MNIKKKTTKLKYKTLFYLIIFSVFILLLLWESQLLLSRFLYERYQIQDVNKIVNNISSMNHEQLNHYLREVVFTNNVCIEYNKNDGNSYFYNDASTGCLLGRNNDEINEIKSDLMDKRKSIAVTKFNSNELDSKVMLYKVDVNDGYVFVFTLLSNINKNYSIVKRQLIYITIVVIIFAVLISLYLSKLITDPIIEINNKAKQLADGNYNVQFGHDGIREIDELSDTLNYLEHEVSKTDEYRRDLMANVSHDLKTPLTMIKAYAEMVRDITYKDKKKREENLNIIIDETDRLNILVGDILALSKMQSNSETLEIENFDLVEEIKSIVSRYDYIVEDGYVIETDMPDKIIVRADKKKINQVIYNLINNAINYTGDDKKVTIRVTSNKKDCLVEVIDTGKGIEADKINYIWDRYYKNEKNHKRNIIGTGLGLSIVKNILEKHNFKYGVNSVINEGTTFFFKVKTVNQRKK